MKVWMPAIRASSGADVYTRRLSGALAQAGVEVEVTWLPPAFEVLPVLHRRVPTPPGVDLVHANSWTAAALSGRGLPVVATVHHLVHDPAYAPYRSVAQALYHRHHVLPREREAIRGAASVVAVSPHVRASVTRLMGREDVDVVPNWVDCERFSPDPRGGGARGAGPFRLLWVGNNSRRKGVDLLAPLLARLGPGFELRGTGGLRGGAARRRSGDGITWLGRLSDDALVSEYRACDVVVSTSRYEGFGYSALEGMACGKPVVAFAAGGLQDVVRHGRTGTLVPLEDLDAMAAAIAALAGSPAMASAFGAQGRAEALRHAANWRAYLDVYRRALARR